MSWHAGSGSRTGVSSMSNGQVLRDAEDFSLVLGGPLFQFLRKLHLTDDALTLVRQRVVVVTLVTWLPLAVLAALQGHLLGSRITTPFLLDADVHVRFLIAVPLLIVAELIVHRRIRPIAFTFLERKLIPDSAVDRFDAAMISAFRLRNSPLAEVLLLGAVYSVGVMVMWQNYTTLATATWYFTPTASGPKLLLAGIWYRYVSLPIFQFLMIRWYFRLFIWARFLWQVSRIELQLVATHPDHLGGLGFLGQTVYAFALLLIAQSAVLSGRIADRIFFLGASLPDFKYEIAILVGLLLAIVFGPLLVFIPRLAEAKRAGLRQYGALAQRYVREFDAKWLRGAAKEGEPLIGSADIQSLADMANSFEVVRTMRLVPITRNALVQLTVAAAAPLAPLALTMVPAEVVLKKLLGLVF